MLAKWPGLILLFVIIVLKYFLDMRMKYMVDILVLIHWIWPRICCSNFSTCAPRRALLCNVHFNWKKIRRYRNANIKLHEAADSTLNGRDRRIAVDVFHRFYSTFYWRVRPEKSGTQNKTKNKQNWKQMISNSNSQGIHKVFVRELVKQIASQTNLPETQTRNRPCISAGRRRCLRMLFNERNKTDTLKNTPEHGTAKKKKKKKKKCDCVGVNTKRSDTPKP